MLENQTGEYYFKQMKCSQKMKFKRKEQLIGVDVAYFEILIKALRGKFSSDEDFKLNTEYFNKLVDKIFNENEL